MFKKKIAALVTAATITLTAGFPAAPAQAFGVGDIIGIGAKVAGAAVQGRAIKKQIQQLNDTEEGRQQLYQVFREKQGVNSDPVLNAKLDTLMRNLSAAVAKVDPTIKDKPYLYFVSADESLNAACGMGHIMMVNAGTFKHLPNDDELAAVVGHEMGHGQKDHAAKGVMKNLNKTVVTQIAVGAAGAGGNLAGAAAEVVGGIALTHSVAHGSRKQETEADNLSFDYILHTNYNPGACAAVMQRFVDLMGEQEKKRDKFLNPSDHPDSDKRRDNYVKRLYEYSGKHVTAADGVVKVNNKILMTVAPADSMTSAERAFFVVGNLATAYHKGKNIHEATVQNGTVMLGDQPIVIPAAGDEDAQTIADRLNSIK